MNTQTFNHQYKQAGRIAKLHQEIEAFVINDKSALQALREFHERIRTLSADLTCPKRLYFLSEDLCKLLEEALDYWDEEAAPVWDGKSDHRPEDEG